ncbi:MAG: MBL fold metallo-hydrolase [Caldilineae bacterium]|nr:MAG: MBL fold metallo-hydrolase [Caldilineae bacterium]
MTIRERISEHVYVFRSTMYAQVNAGLVTTDEGCVLIDTLPFPQETREILNFVENRLRSHVRYIILTHSHADHVYGAYLFPEAEVVGHLLSRELLIKHTRPALAQARQRNSALGEVTLRLPTILTERQAALRVGGFTLHIYHSPGHAPDVVNVYVQEEKVYFASDTIMPTPYFVNGNIDSLRRSLLAIKEIPRVEDVVQGHGEVLLRGEVSTVIDAQLAYLDKIEAHVQEVLAAGGGKEELNQLDLEDCGLSRIALNGLVQQLHRANMYFLYGLAKRKQSQQPAGQAAR